MPTGSPSLSMRSKVERVVDHHFDDQKPGKPLRLLIPGGLLALLALGTAGVVAKHAWLDNALPQEVAQRYLILIAPVYVAGVFLFSYGYEVYDLQKALQLTFTILIVTVGVVLIVAVLFSLASGSGKSSSSSSSSSKSRASSNVPVHLDGINLHGLQTLVTPHHATVAAAAAVTLLQCARCAHPFGPDFAGHFCEQCGTPVTGA